MMEQDARRLQDRFHRSHRRRQRWRSRLSWEVKASILIVARDEAFTWATVSQHDFMLAMDAVIWTADTPCCSPSLTRPSTVLRTIESTTSALSKCTGRCSGNPNCTHLSSSRSSAPLHSENTGETQTLGERTIKPTGRWERPDLRESFLVMLSQTAFVTPSMTCSGNEWRCLHRTVSVWQCASTS